MVVAVLIALLKAEMVIVFLRAIGCKAKRKETQINTLFWKCKWNKLWCYLSQMFHFF